MKNIEISFADHKQSQANNNYEFINPFNSTFNMNKYQHPTQSSIEKQDKNRLDSSSRKKSSKIQQAKQLLAKRLKEVTSFKLQKQVNNQCQESNLNQHLIQNKHVQCHLNPISKLTRQPFVRSKTCDQIRKQYSQKKQRHNSSTKKFSTPNTHANQRDVHSTGIMSGNTDNPFTCHSSSQIKLEDISKRAESHVIQSKDKGGQLENVNVKEFMIVEPQIYRNHLVETFDQNQLKYRAVDQNRQKTKYNKFAQKKQNRQDKQISSLSPQIFFPFKINSNFNNEKSNFKRQNENIASNSKEQIIEKTSQQQFTPKLQRYSTHNKEYTKTKQTKVNNLRLQMKPNLSNQMQSIHQISSSIQQPQNSYQQMFPSISHNRSSVRSANPYPNQLFTNLHMTNTILEQKLKLKELQIQELNQNYCRVKNQLFYMKSLKRQDKEANYQERIHDQTNSFRIYQQQQQLQLTNNKYLTSLQIQPLPSPKFQDGIQDQFTRQRSINRNETYIDYRPAVIKFQKKRQLFSSDLSQKVSQQFDSEEFYHMNKQTGYDESRIMKKNVFKKSNFYQQDYKQLQHKRREKGRDSLVYALKEDSQEQSNEQKYNNEQENHIDSLDILSSNSRTHQGSKVSSQQMLLQSGVDKNQYRINPSQNKIQFLSPIKCNSSGNKIIISQHKERNFPIRRDNDLLSETSSMKRFDYYLTPQKDQEDEQIFEKNQQNQGLFEKAVSSMKKKQPTNIQGRSGSHSPKKIEKLVDTIIQSSSQ